MSGLDVLNAHCSSEMDFLVLGQCRSRDTREKRPNPRRSLTYMGPLAHLVGIRFLLYQALSNGEPLASSSLHTSSPGRGRDRSKTLPKERGKHSGRRPSSHLCHRRTMETKPGPYKRTTHPPSLHATISLRHPPRIIQRQCRTFASLVLADRCVLCR